MQHRYPSLQRAPSGHCDNVPSRHRIASSRHRVFARNRVTAPPGHRSPSRQRAIAIKLTSARNLASATPNRRVIASHRAITPSRHSAQVRRLHRATSQSRPGGSIRRGVIAIQRNNARRHAAATPWHRVISRHHAFPSSRAGSSYGVLTTQILCCNIHLQQTVSNCNACRTHSPVWSPTRDVLNITWCSQVCTGFQSSIVLTTKVATLACKNRSTGSPAYLLPSVGDCMPTRQLRSSTQLLLVKPPVRTEIARRAFSQAAPAVWNSLPHETRNA